ncbi:hypothetical protein D9758_012944 [Tetrapyrgos nigripes]|uniref:Uncharacterized protein n=1 Tax=Tetrapyrgos nigripes TaxID=182062 RepID=A0A8H5CL93_9AGAR|nr:hypothetical protein D9758_012944 [Tetrapyrgos nigripes]
MPPPPKPQKVRPLSQKQERRLIEYLEEELLQLARGYQKRLDPSTHLPTLDDYLQAAQKILAMILRIPPLDPSTSLRTQLLLRLTNDVLSSVLGYPPTTENLVLALDWLDDLDQAWVSVLQTQIWDPNEGIGVDLEIDVDDAAKGMKSTGPSQTERTRLKSLLTGGVATLEEWVEGMAEDNASGDASTGGEVRDVVVLLTSLGIQEDFDNLFARSLDELRDVGGFDDQDLDL